MEGIDPDDIIDMSITKDGLALMYRSVCFHIDKWPGGHPEEQEALYRMKDNLFRIILEKTLERNFWRDFFYPFWEIKSRFWFSSPSI